jgi:SAM-dependent methyltransferase
MSLLLVSWRLGAFKAGMAHVLDFYDRHPINAEQALEVARRHRALRGRPLTPEDLFDVDQDHYGGLAAVEMLARRAAVGPGTRVLDVCAGLAGPARFLAWQRGCRVVALELNAGRAAGGAQLTRLVGLAGRVTVVRGDARTLPFAPGRFDACLSQEGLLHVDDKLAALRECHRVLRPGGRLAFSDWIAHRCLGERERERLSTWMAATTLQTIEGYRELLGRAGLHAIEAEDLTDEWRHIVRARQEAGKARREARLARFGEAWCEQYDRIHAFFVGLVEAGKLGGVRFTASA